MYSQELRDPVTLAEKSANSLFSVRGGDVSEIAEDAIIGNLEETARVLGFLNRQYEVKAARVWSLSLAALAEERPEDERQYFRQLFKGELWGYAIASNGTDDRVENVIATLCLVFADVILLPSGETMSRDEALSVPVLGVERIELLQ